MIYKYMKLKWGLKLLSTGRVRYAQFDATNDLLEGKVHITQLMSSKDILEAKQAGYPFVEDGDEIAKVANSIVRGEKTDADACAEIGEAYRCQRSHWGMLSMSATWNSSPMWTHYADGHTGFVIGLDEHHEYFRGGPAALQPVIYSSQFVRRPLMYLTGLDLWFTKGIQWAYEEERRHVRPLHGVEPSMIVEGKEIYEFEIPSEVIKEVILGAHTEHAEVEQVVAACGKYAGLAKADVYQIHASDEDYSLLKWNKFPNEF